MYLNKFSQRLKDLMELEGISQRALSLKIKVDRKSIRFWMKGTYFPKYHALIRLSACLNVHIDYLIGLEDIMGNGINIHSEVPTDKQVKQRFYVLVSEYIENNLTKYALSKALRIDQKALTKWLTVGSMPELATIIRLAQLMNISVQELLIGQDGAISSTT